jgi:uncharacterized protein (DUF433 family)
MNSLLERITIEPGKAGGRPCIPGLRTRVQDVLEMLAADAVIWDLALASDVTVIEIGR